MLDAKTNAWNQAVYNFEELERHKEFQKLHEQPPRTSVVAHHERHIWHWLMEWAGMPIWDNDNA